MTRQRFVGIGLALCAALTACSTVPGEAVPDSAALKLDTGNYPTAPRDSPAVTSARGSIQGNALLSDYAVVPADVDPAFDAKVYTPFTSINDYNSMTRMLGSALTFGLFYGNVAGVVAPFSELPKTDGTKSAQMTTVFLRYLSEADAATGFAEVKKIPPAAPGQPLPKYPAAYDGPAPTEFGGSPTIWLQHKEYILAVTFKDLSDRARIENLTTAFFDRQIPRLDEVPFKPYAGRAQPADKDGIMRLTMASQNDGYTSGYFTPRAWSIVSTGRWKYSLELYRTYGIDLIGSEGRNQILRASNADRAGDYVRRMGDDYSKGISDGGRREASVPNLPDSVCISRYANLLGSENRVYACLASRGRYVTNTQGSSLLQAQQSTAASWTVLRAAEK